jgi:anti-sigma factor RsiW
MNEHAKIRELLALTAAGALEPVDAQRVEQHAADCAKCAAELEGWQKLALGLRRLPTPQPSAALVERTRILAAEQLAAEADRRSSQLWAFALLAVSWGVTLVSWPIVRLLSSGLLGWLGVDFYQTWLGLAGYTLLAWLTAGVAAALLGQRQRAAGRTL